MFGRIPKIPINVEFGVTLPDLLDTNQQNYAQKLKAWLNMGLQKGEQSKSERSCQAQEILWLYV